MYAHAELLISQLSTTAAWCGAAALAVQGHAEQQQLCMQCAVSVGACIAHTGNTVLAALELSEVSTSHRQAHTSMWN